MLYNKFQNHKDFTGKDFFTDKSKENIEILKNLNPRFSIRKYQQEALGRFYYYFTDYPGKNLPIHLMFNMATGSGKTLIMAAQILYLYQQGYRNFVFFTRLSNIIEKTKDNFLNSVSEKYLFADKIVINGQGVKIKEVENFEGVSEDDINIIFTTTAGLHSKLNNFRENSLTYEDLENKKIVLLADEAHNLSADTASKKLNKGEREDQRNWEKTVMKILEANRMNQNLLLEFTATARLEEDYPEILEKYEDKAIYRYDLKEFRLDKYSKDVKTLQIDAPMMERVLSAVIISQYRRKVAEKYRLAIKPVIMFKANQVNPPKDKSKLEGRNPAIVLSNEFKAEFHELIKNLKVSDIKKQNQLEDETLNKAFNFFKDNDITLANLVKEIKNDFSENKCLSVDEKKDLEEKQILLNSLEDQDNEIRAIFATEKLNEGWDVLNLFDIVRLYDSRDAKGGKPGKTTVQEAQLIGRGARYCPFVLEDDQDKFKRKFDDEPENELRILEELYYHSTTNTRYIAELRKALVKEGIIADRKVEKEIKLKKDFTDSKLFKGGYIFLNKRERIAGNLKQDLAEVSFDYQNENNIFTLPSRQAREEKIFEKLKSNQQNDKQVRQEIELLSLGENIIRIALGRNIFGQFEKLQSIFADLKSIDQFIDKYLSDIKVTIKGGQQQIKNLTQREKLEIAQFVIDEVLKNIQQEKREYRGTKIFEARKVNQVFDDKKLHLDGDSPRAKEMEEYNLEEFDWFAQDRLWGTSEEEAFVKFMHDSIDELKQKYASVVLIRNEQFFKIYNFEDGDAFSPDFVLFLTDKKTKKEIGYQIFVEPKGDGLIDENNRFEKSKEGWKQKFLLQIEKEHEVNFKLKNKDFKLIGLPFYNEGKKNPELRDEFEEVFKDKILK